MLIETNENISTRTFLFSRCYRCTSSRSRSEHLYYTMMPGKRSRQIRLYPSIRKTSRTQTYRFALPIKHNIITQMDFLTLNFHFTSAIYYIVCTTRLRNRTLKSCDGLKVSKKKPRIGSSSITPLHRSLGGTYHCIRYIFPLPCREK